MKKTAQKAFFAAVAVLAAALVVGLAYRRHNPKKLRRVDYGRADAVPVTPQASPETRRLLKYLKSVYGEKVLSGQYVNEYDDFSLPKFRADPDDGNSPPTVFKSNELQAIHSVTGKYPAVLGLDMSGVECGARCSSIEQALEWNEAGGVVTMCWHWQVDNFDGKPRAFYTDYTDFDLGKVLADKSSKQYLGLLNDIDILCGQFKILQKAGVPILWRPLHEASGGWFWWGASGPDAFRELWDLLYDRMTNTHGLNNLIWVYNGLTSDWYVGDGKCDLIGDDIYHNEGGRKAYLKDPADVKRFAQNYRISKNKLIAMSENDFVPNADAMFAANARWSFFCTWCREFVCLYAEDEQGNSYLTPKYSEKCSTAGELKALYNDARVLTLEDLRQAQ